MQDLTIQGRAVREASKALAQASNEQRRGVLERVADLLEELEDELLSVNAAEVAAYDESGPGRDRLTLTKGRIEAMASALREIAAAPDPLFEVVDRNVRPNGLPIERLRVPLGVIGVVYENRPNVTSDVAGLCVRSGNAGVPARLLAAIAHEQDDRRAVERGAREGGSAGGRGLHSSRTPRTRWRAAFMQMTDVFDCLIPRGGPSLIAAMREPGTRALRPRGDGNCHVYVDAPRTSTRRWPSCSTPRPRGPGSATPRRP